jgi:hypothetical protein
MSACYFDDHMPNRCRTTSDGDGGRMFIVLPSNHGVTIVLQPTTLDACLAVSQSVVAVPHQHSLSKF